MKKAQRQAMVESAANLNPGLVSHELERLANLRDKAVLSESEFQQAKEGLLKTLTDKPSIGFHV